MFVLALPRLHVHAAPQSETRPVFEAASVKPNDSRVGERDASFAGGRLAMRYSTLRELITFAYPRQDGRLRYEPEMTGGPSWLDSDHFDVIAKAGVGIGTEAGNVPAAAATAAELSAIRRVQMMTRTLLEDRFKLAVHNELRDLAAYELRLDRNDGRLGPQLKRVDLDCVALRARSAGDSRGCGGFRSTGPGHTSAHAVTMSMLAQFLEAPVSRNVFDRTGLQGNFDAELQWTPERRRLGAEAPAGDPAGVSIFTAIREQLGLKLESTRAPVDVLVIDHVERPTPD
jgi:uncharacterized protein (TIGR03435 family)